ncbi:MAG: FAD-dependent oxidoreductase [Candidatus Aegiribacteria sp.]|nr:FAD-dependent oxidoreductase [Candidatus Aegiribacteria sp.]
MKYKIAVLGAGPAGLWTALSLLEKFNDLEITVIEKENCPGGITASFQYKGMIFDYGSHRLHPAADPRLLNKIRKMLGSDLLERPRNGRIWLEGRFIAFPLNPVNLLFNLPFSFSSGVMLDSLVSSFRRKKEGISFEDTLLSGLGKTISSRFYFPYARKLWGLPPSKLSPVQARKRIASGSIGKMIGKALSSISGSSRKTGIFYYPRQGFGQIAQVTAATVEKLGANIIFNAEVVSIIPPAEEQMGTVVISDGRKINTDFIFSTIPVTEFAGLLDPAVPRLVSDAAKKLSFRSMIFCILQLPISQYTPFDAHYFPGPETCFSRLSEPKNYSLANTPSDRTGLCFEIPCGDEDELWELSNEEILRMVLDDLKKTDLPVPEVKDFTVRRKKNVYPVYDQSFSSHLDIIERHLRTFSRMVSLGRQGLFVHDNTHHTIDMGIAAVDCLSPALKWDADRWALHREKFNSHIVVD